MNDPIKVDNPITSKIDRYKTWSIPFCKNNIEVENKDLGCTFSSLKFVRMPHEGWMKNDSKNSFTKNLMKL